MTTLDFLKKIGAVTLPEKIIRQAEDNTNKPRATSKKQIPVRPAD